MPRGHKKYTAELKLKAVLETLQRDTTIEAVRKKFGIHITQLGNWRKQFFSKSNQVASLVFESSKLGSNSGRARFSSKSSQNGKSVEELTRIIGELTIENTILKKALENLD